MDDFQDDARRVAALADRLPYSRPDAEARKDRAAVLSILKRAEAAQELARLGEVAGGDNVAKIASLFRALYNASEQEKARANAAEARVAELLAVLRESMNLREAVDAFGGALFDRTGAMSGAEKAWREAIDRYAEPVPVRYARTDEAGPTAERKL